MYELEGGGGEEEGGKGLAASVFMQPGRHGPIGSWPGSILDGVEECEGYDCRRRLHLADVDGEEEGRTRGRGGEGGG